MNSTRKELVVGNIVAGYCDDSNAHGGGTVRPIEVNDGGNDFGARYALKLKLLLFLLSFSCFFRPLLGLGISNGGQSERIEPGLAGVVGCGVGRKM